MFVLEAKKLTKVFPGVVALDQVDISFEAGKVHCIVGENGAGKSTLIKCLTGLYKAESGTLFFNGKNMSVNPELFKQVVHVPQEIDLFMHMSVAENLFIPYNRSGMTGFISQRKLEEAARPILHNLGIHAQPHQLVDSISVADQQLLQIARATMQKGYRVMILDEPTSSLTTTDAERVFDVIRKQKALGIAIIFVSHKLDEVFDIGDTLSVFRNGRNVEQANIHDVDESWVIERMIGHRVDAEVDYASTSTGGDDILSVSHLYGPGFKDVSFALKRGEILGFSGLVGAGRSELMQSVFGLNAVYSGEIRWKNEPLRHLSSTDSVRMGLIYLPEDRKKMGILPRMSIESNISILSLKQLLKHGMLSVPSEKEKVREYAKRYDVRTPNLSREIRFLSGGNQQKAIIGRSMMAKPQAIILDEPTKGIDVGAKQEIYKLMKELAEAGLGVIFVSSELEEITKCCNRVIVMYQGGVVAEFSGKPDKASLVSAIIGRLA